MALNTFKCNYLTPLHFEGLKAFSGWQWNISKCNRPEVLYIVTADVVTRDPAISTQPHHRQLNIPIIKQTIIIASDPGDLTLSIVMQLISDPQDLKLRYAKSDSFRSYNLDCCCSDAEFFVRYMRQDKTRQRGVTDAGTTVPLSPHHQCRNSDDNIYFIQLKTLIDLRFRLGSLSNQT